MNKEKARFNMVEQQIRTWGVLDSTVLNLMASVPRELFVPESSRSLAFADLAIELPHHQAMYAPREEARMVQSLKIQKSDKALEIGTGTGFTAALIASLANTLLTVDQYAEFIDEAEKRFRQLNLTNIKTEVSDVATGWKPSERYDVIAITPSLSAPPTHYIKLLKAKGRLFCIEGPIGNMHAYLYAKSDTNEISKSRLFEIETPRLTNEQLEPVFEF